MYHANHWPDSFLNDNGKNPVFPDLPPGYAPGFIGLQDDGHGHLTGSWRAWDGGGPIHGTESGSSLDFVGDATSGPCGGDLTGTFDATTMTVSSPGSAKDGCDGLTFYLHRDAPLLPDLTGRFTGPIPSTVGLGTTIQPGLVVSNGGQAEAKGDETTDYYLSTTPDLSGKIGSPVFSSYALDLQPGESAPAEPQTFTIPANTPNGTYYLVAQVNAGGAIQESDTTNNVVTSGQIKIGDLPDLSARFTSGIPASVAAGGLVNPSLTIRDAGGAAHGAGATVYYLSTTPDFNSAPTPVYSTGEELDLQDGQTYTEQPQLTIPRGTPAGTYYLVARINAGGSFKESDAASDSNDIAVSEPVTVLSPLTVSVDGGAIVPIQSRRLHLHHLFGGERAAVPIAIGGIGPSDSNDDVSIKLSLSTDPAVFNPNLEFPPVLVPPSVYFDSGLAPRAFTADVVIPEGLPARTKYYFVAEASLEYGSGGGVTTTTNHTIDPFRYAGSPVRNPDVFTDGHYTRFISDLLAANGAGAKVLDNTALDKQRKGSDPSDPKQFIGAFEGDYPFPYLDSKGIPTIGVGINIAASAIGGSLKSNLVKDVRDFYGRYYPKVKLGPKDDDILNLLRTQAARNDTRRGTRSFSDTRPAISNVHDKVLGNQDQSLFNQAYADHRKNVIGKLGQATWDAIGRYAQVALVDQDYNTTGGLFGSVANALKSSAGPDFVSAGFQLVDKLRTSQVSRRTEADYENLMFSRRTDLGTIA